MFFKNELTKRKQRTKALGMNFKQEELQEYVWLDLTFKLTSWALANGFDSFVNKNAKEGKEDYGY